MKQILMIVSLISFLLLAGCATKQTSAPVQQQQHYSVEVNNTTNDTIPLSPVKLEVKEENVTDSDGTIVAQIKFNQSTVDLTNCGPIAYGSLMVDEVNSILKRSNYTLGNLTITDVSERYIGGCEEVISNLGDIKAVVIKTNATSDYLTNALRWVPVARVHYE